MTLYPVLAPIPQAPQQPPPVRMERQRDYARRALRHCAGLTGAPADGWRQAHGGAPIPNGEFHWSISHTRGLAAAVIAKEPVGIDVERIRPRRHELFSEVGADVEWAMLDGPTWATLFRLWTAKEAVLKANSLGIAHLRKCRLDKLAGAERMTILFGGAEWTVVHHYPDAEHVAALAIGRATRANWAQWPARPAPS